MSDDKIDTIAHAAHRPDVAALLDEFKRCAPASGMGWNSQSQSDQTRFARWAGQAPDFRKHNTGDRKAKPFDGASDSQCFLADDIINARVAEDFESFWRAWLMPKMGESEESGYALKLADHFVSTLCYDQLYAAVELSSQYKEHYGWVALQPAWTRELSLENKTITLAQITKLAETGDELMRLLPQMILDPNMDQDSAAVLQALYQEYTKGVMAKVKDFQPKPLKASLAAQAIRELREQGKTDVPVPYLCKDLPEVFVRCPWREVFITGDTADLSQRRAFLVCWEDEVALRGRIAKGWTESWVNAALEHKGTHTAWTTLDGPASYPNVSLSAELAGGGGVTWSQQDYKDNLVEVIYCFYRALDANDVPGVYMTVINPHVGTKGKGENAKDTYGWHGLVSGARGRIPLRIGTRERVAANFTSSRGVTDVTASQQREMKVQRDALIDFTSLSVFPPRNRYANNYGTQMNFGPGAVNQYTHKGNEETFVDIPTKGVPLAVEMLTMLGLDAREYFGLATERMPQGNPSKRQKFVGSFLLLWTTVIQDWLDLARVNMDDAQFARITGAPEGWLEAHRSAAPGFGVQLQFDVRELDPEYVLKQMDVMNKTVIPADVTGSVDRNKWTRRQLRMVSPILARDLASDQGEASQRLYNDVSNEIAKMFLGNEPQYVENDPAAQIKLQYATQIVQANPIYMQQLQTGQGRFAELIQKWVTNLQFSLTQEENKKIGSIGVKPEEEMAASGGRGMAPARANGNGRY